MRLGEVCLLTNDVVRLAGFYRQLLGLEGANDDPVHQFVIAEETMLTVYNDGASRPRPAGNIQLAFTTDDVEATYAKVKALGAEVLTPPTKQPWGAINMSLRDPDGNLLFIRQLPR